MGEMYLVVEEEVYFFPNKMHSFWNLDPDLPRFNLLQMTSLLQQHQQLADSRPRHSID